MIIPQAVYITYSSQVHPQTISQVRKVSPVQDNGLMCRGIKDRSFLVCVINFLQRYSLTSKLRQPSLESDTAPVVTVLPLSPGRAEENNVRSQ
ncbi:hypothetical protein QTP88_012082 [Uroleucon formosanum]